MGCVHSCGGFRDAASELLLHARHQSTVDSNCITWQLPCCRPAQNACAMDSSEQCARGALHKSCNVELCCLPTEEIMLHCARSDAMSSHELVQDPESARLGDAHELLRREVQQLIASDRTMMLNRFGPVYARVMWCTARLFSCNAGRPDQIMSRESDCTM